MAVQDDVNLNVPLSATDENKLEQVKLTPNRAQAALNLHGDYYIQLLSKCNTYVFWHPVSVVLFLIAGSIVLFAQLKEFFINFSLSNGSFFGQLITHRDFKFRLVLVFPVLVGFVGMVALIAHIITDDFKKVADKLTRPEYISEVFGFNLNGFARLPVDEAEIKKSSKAVKDLAANGDNTTLLVYRFSPIAIATVKPLHDHTTDSTFFVKITGIQVRRVFKKVDFESLLLEWAKVRATQLFLEETKSKKGLEKLTILIDTYNFDKEMIRALDNQFYTKVGSSFEIFPFPVIKAAEDSQENVAQKGVSHFLRVNVMEALNKIYGVKKYTYALTLSPNAKVEKIAEEKKNTAVKKRKA